MKLEYLNLCYNNYEHVNDENLLTFDVRLKDLDLEFLSGSEFNFTLVVSDDPKYNTSEVAKQILSDYKDGKINVSEIKEFEDPCPLEIIVLTKTNELRNFKNKLIDEGFISYDCDIFSIDDKSLSRLSSTIQTLLFQESQNNLDRETYKHKWVSQSGIVHEFTLEQLLELNKLTIEEVQKIILRYNYLVYDVIPTIKDKKELHFLDWYYVSDESNNDN